MIYIIKYEPTINNLSTVLPKIVCNCYIPYYLYPLQIKPFYVKPK